MSSSTERQTEISLTPPPKPRLRLQPDRSARIAGPHATLLSAAGPRHP